MTHTPASGPFVPLTTPPMSDGPIFCAYADTLTNAATNSQASLITYSRSEPAECSEAAARATKNSGPEPLRAATPIILLARRLHRRRRSRSAPASAIAHDERHHERDQEEPEQDFCDSRGGAGDAGEAEDRRDDRDDEEPNRPAKHRGLQRFGLDNRRSCKQRADAALRRPSRRAGPAARLAVRSLRGRCP